VDDFESEIRLRQQDKFLVLVPLTHCQDAGGLNACVLDSSVILTASRSWRMCKLQAVPISQKTVRF